MLCCNFDMSLAEAWSFQITCIVWEYGCMGGDIYPFMHPHSKISWTFDSNCYPAQTCIQYTQSLRNVATTEITSEMIDGLIKDIVYIQFHATQIYLPAIAMSTELSLQLFPSRSTSRGTKGPNSASLAAPPRGGTRSNPTDFSCLSDTQHSLLTYQAQWLLVCNHLPPAGNKLFDRCLGLNEYCDIMRSMCSVSSE